MGRIFFLKLLILASLNVSFLDLASQNCYVKLGDYSGFNTDYYQGNLESVACDLVNSLPEEQRSQFKVFSFAFYSIGDYWTGGFETVFQQAKVLASSRSQYYLLFAKQTDSKGVYNKIWISANIPPIAGNCSTVQNGKIESLIQSTTNQTYLRNNNDPYFYYRAEIEAMNLLKNLIISLSKGNCCLPTDQDALPWLTEEGFSKIPINIKVLPSDPAITNKSEIRRTTQVRDFTNYSLSFNGRSLDLNEKLTGFAEYLDQKGTKARFAVIGNPNICDNNYEVAQSYLIDGLPNYGALIYIRDLPDDNSTDELFVKFYGVENEDLPISFSTEEENYIVPSGGAINFEDLISALREAENKLIAAGYTKIGQRIEIIRGIFYGTTWSMDYSQMQSAVRNNGFKTYLCDASTPINPKDIIGEELFQKLFKSPEVTDGLNGIDFGHILIGLEARLNYCSREARILFHLSSGLELTTWIGDIGGGAGMLAFRRASNPQKRAVDMFSDGHNFGGWINIEGNIAAYIIGRDTKNFDATPNVSSNDNAYVADMLQTYLLPQPALPNSEWHNRAKTFTIMLGANLDNQGNITNETQFKAELTKKILDFAENYALQQTFREPQVKMYEVSKHLDGAAKEMTEIFIHTLKEAIKNPAAPIRTKGINPNPIPPGKPQTIFRLQKNIEDGLKQLEEWIKK